MQGVIFHLKI